MNKFNVFISNVFIGGLVVVLPVVILVLVFGYVFKFVTGLIEPLSKLLGQHFGITGALADLIVVALILAVLFFIGLFVQTKFGKLIHQYIERKYLEATPGYKLIKDTTSQLVGGSQSSLSKVALVRPFDTETLATAFVTKEHSDGSYTVFVPMAPPTSGFVFHLKASQVQLVDITAEEGMQTMISFGAGSAKLMEKYRSSVKSS